jgi:hypothetical protein
MSDVIANPTGCCPEDCCICPDNEGTYSIRCQSECHAIDQTVNNVVCSDSHLVAEFEGHCETFTIGFYVDIYCSESGGVYRPKLDWSVIGEFCEDNGTAVAEDWNCDLELEFVVDVDCCCEGGSGNVTVTARRVS